VTIAHQADPLQPPQRYVPSVERARSELALESWVSLERAIEKTIRWLRDHNYESDLQVRGKGYKDRA
jgi:nucleoside-diphosphate-sugar epimerase